MKSQSPFNQLKFLWHEILLLKGKNHYRWIYMFLTTPILVLVSYRIQRFICLSTGKFWPLFRIITFPFFLALRILGGMHEISYRADIGKGIQIIHTSLGVVVHGNAIIGKSCRLAGGNSIGAKMKIKPGDLVVGNNVFLGINSCVIGPAVIGNNVVIGAGAIVVGDLPDNCVAAGVPAKVIRHEIYEK